MREKRTSRTVSRTWAGMAVFLIVLFAQVAWGAPTVTVKAPGDGATNIPAATAVAASFSEAMNPATITTGSFALARVIRIRAIAAGYYHTVALKNDGTVAAWGYNAYGQAKVPAGLSGVTAAAAGANHTVALNN